MMAPALSAQDPLRPRPVVVHPEAAPPAERQPKRDAENPAPAEGTQGGGSLRPPPLGGTDIERSMAGASTESRAAADAGHRDLQAHAPEAAWRRWLMIGLIVCGAGGLLLFAIARWFRQRTL